MIVYIIKNNWYDSQQGEGYPNTGTDIVTIKLNEIEAIEAFNELKKKDRQDSSSYSKTLIYGAEIDQGKEFEEIDITDRVNETRQSFVRRTIKAIRQQHTTSDGEMEIYIIKKDSFSADQGELPNADMSIIDISFDKNKAIEEFNKSQQNDNYWNGGHNKTLISKAKIGKNIPFREEDITEYYKKNEKKNNDFTHDVTDLASEKSKLGEKAAAAKDLAAKYNEPVKDGQEGPTMNDDE